MKAWLLNMDKFVPLNHIQEVTNPIPFDKGMIFTDDGIFSNVIFGMSMYDRKHKWGYINLQKRYLHPKVFITLKALNRNFEALIYGTKKFKIDSKGVLVPDEEGETGIDFLYKNWEKIKFEKNDSTKRSQRIDVIENNTKDVLFWDKCPIIPAFYRDVNIQSSDSKMPRVPEINDVYNAIIRNVTTITTANNFISMTNALIGKTEQLMVDMYNLLKAKVEKKNGYLRRAVMGKSVDLCARVVITAVPYDKNSVHDQKINFYYTGVPLAQSLAMTSPFILWWTRRYLKGRLADNLNSFPILLKNGEKVYVKLENPEIQFNEEYIDRILTRWVKNPSSRFDKIEIPIKKESREKYGIKGPYYMSLTGYHEVNDTTMQRDSNSLTRPLTWTDIFYMAAVDVTSDKHVIVTRYPFLDYLGLFISRITILSTRDTVPMIINDRLYEDYPKIDLDNMDENLDSLFVDSFKLCPLYLSAIGGDHDGDQITAKILFTQEANEEAERIMMSKTNFITTSGGPSRKIGNEGVQTLFTMTSFKN